LKQVISKLAGLTVSDVAAPNVQHGTVLLRVAYSTVSVGTESVGLRQQADPLWLRALKDPKKIVKAARMASEKGVRYTRDVAVGTMEAGSVAGYSLAGTVIEVGPGVDTFSIGDRVACASAQAAHHAEYVCVPVNLTAPIPDTVSFEDASTVALGAIALQGVRRTVPSLGETIIVIGLGFLGQLTVQMLKANGCRVLGTDLDPSRVEAALNIGMDAALSEQDIDAGVKRITGGVGADAVIITAASASSTVISSAFKMCRRKARVVIVGDIGMDIDRSDIYAKELDVKISTSYGPGRYDRAYEEMGHDYPLAYVRWTENRNMRCYLEMLAAGAIDLKELSREVFSLDQMSALHSTLVGSENRPLSVLIKYPNDPSSQPVRKVENVHAIKKASGIINVGIIGAGGFVQGTHLPNFRRLDDIFQCHAVMGRKGHSAKSIADMHGAAYSTTSLDEILSDEKIDLVLIGTRHDTHAGLVCEALRAGKNVFVEKPLAIDNSELNEIAAIYDDSTLSPGLLMTGFNRRFAPCIAELQKYTSLRSGPLMVTYRMNAGFLPADHWVHGSEGGGRNIGEACHIYDLFNALTVSEVTDVQAMGVGNVTGQYLASDNFTATFRYADGSVATLIYASFGSASHPKESMDVYFDGQVFSMHDYQSLKCAGDNSVKTLISSDTDKGHFNMLKSLGSAIQTDAVWPISLTEQILATKMSFDVEAALRTGGMR
tara:strand:- start:15235 stop:17382 length:2148 start_codon:yes stop_codon:yes gene_type:complete